MLPPCPRGLLVAGALVLAAGLVDSRNTVAPRVVTCPMPVAVPVPVPEPTPAPEPSPTPAPEPIHGVRAAGDTVIAWTPSQLLLQQYEGGPFRPILDAPGRILGADVGDDGTIYLVREDRLGVLVGGLEQTWRRLPFGSWPDWPLVVDDVFTDGAWLGIVADTSVALTRDQGRSWKVLAIAGELDYPQHAAVVGARLITTGARYGFEGIDSYVQVRTLVGRAVGKSVHEYESVAGIGHDGAVYTRCSGAPCSDEEYARPGWYGKVVRAPGVTIGVRDRALFRIGKGRETALTTVPEGLLLQGADAQGRVYGLDARGVVRWSAADGWVVLLPGYSPTT